MMRLRSRAWTLPERFSWARRTAMSLPWAAQTRTQHTAPYGTRWLLIACLEALAEVQRQLWRPVWQSLRWEPTREARFASQGRFAAIPALMPTYGRVSRYGLIAFASSLDRIGPFTTNVADAVAVLSVVAGHDPRIRLLRPCRCPDYAAEAGKPLHGLRIGVADEYFGEGLDAGVKGPRLRPGIRLLESLGCVRVPHTDGPHRIRHSYLLYCCYSRG